MTDDEARILANEQYARGSDDTIEVDEDARVIHLDEQGTGVEGWAWVQTWVLVEPPS